MVRLLRDGDKKKRNRRRQRRIECRELPALGLITAHCHRSNRDKLLSRKKKRRLTLRETRNRIQIPHRHALPIETFPAHSPARPFPTRTPTTKIRYRQNDVEPNSIYEINSRFSDSVFALHRAGYNFQSRANVSPTARWGGGGVSLRPDCWEALIFARVTLFPSGRELSANYCN